MRHTSILECQTCGSLVNEDEMTAPFSDMEPGCPSCGGGDFLEWEDDAEDNLTKAS